MVALMRDNYLYNNKALYCTFVAQTRKRKSSFRYTIFILSNSLYARGCMWCDVCSKTFLTWCIIIAKILLKVKTRTTRTTNWSMMKSLNSLLASQPPSLFTYTEFNVEICIHLYWYKIYITKTSIWHSYFMMMITLQCPKCNVHM